MPKKMLLIDGSNHAFRVQFALPPMHAADGFPTRALYGFTTLLTKIIRVQRPDYVVVSFDKGKTFRHEMFPDYKGHRPDMPEDLRQQWDQLPVLVEAFGYPCLIVPDYEADDVLGTLAATYGGPDMHVFLVTGDKDYYQLVNEHVTVLDLMKDRELGPAEVEEKFGVPPGQVIDVLAMAGDSSDNVPGIPGVGPKTAIKYLQTYGTLDGTLEAAKAGKIKGKTGQKVADNEENARLSKKLVTICTTVPIGRSLDELAPRGLQKKTLRRLFERWEFGAISQKLLGSDAVEMHHYDAVSTDKALAGLVASLRQAGRFTLHLETDSADPRAASLLGIGVAWSEDDVAWVPLRPVDGVDLDRDDALATLAPLLADPDIGKSGHDLKFAVRVLANQGLELAGIDGDVMLLDYVLAAHEEDHSLDGLAFRHLGHTIAAPAPGEDWGSLGFDTLHLEEAALNGGERAHLAWMLEDKLLPRVSEGTGNVYRTIELPLVPVLARLERTGIRVDAEELARVHTDISARVEDLIVECQRLAGREFNVRSRVELSQILFEELELPAGRKLKDGNYSTDKKELDKLLGLHPLPAAIQKFRELDRLRGSYLESLPGHIASDGRIHTSFNQAVAATGRLSSAEPNLQNIPIRTADGRRIRQAFVPEEGWKLVSADYSQIELRVLAHFCGGGALVDAFASGEDIHRRTAAEVFEVPVEEVTSELRGAAKAINYGLMYGQQAFALAALLSIPQKQAQQYIDDYFGRMPQVADYLEKTRELARTQGWVETMFGRKRILLGIHSKRWHERQAAEREGINTPVQGTAADLIKLAMLAVAPRLAPMQARMLLQVHDELVIECPPEEVEAVKTLLVEEMQGVGKDMIVPLEVNVAVGDNWDEAHG